jgi:hypothetical protein
MVDDKRTLYTRFSLFIKLTYENAKLTDSQSKKFIVSNRGR